MWPDYNKTPVDIFEETVWIVNDPWQAQDIAFFFDRQAADMFAKIWMERKPSGG
jgi:hypothetical protein